MARRKTWQEKLDNGREPKVVRLEKNFSGVAAGSDLLVSTPREVERFIRRIPPGRFVDPKELRGKLAAKHSADAACPVSTGIFLRIVAEAAWEEIQHGKDPSSVAPFWRVVAPGSALEQRLSCGSAFVRKMQRQEGITVSPWRN
jgi:hypothetical protein